MSICLFPIQLPPCPSQHAPPNFLAFFLPPFFDNLLSPVSATHMFMDVIHSLERGKQQWQLPQKLLTANNSSIGGWGWRFSTSSMLDLVQVSCRQSQRHQVQDCVNHVMS